MKTFKEILLTLLAALGMAAGVLTLGAAEVAAADGAQAELTALVDKISDADPDGDGFTNWQEFLLGTDPKDYYNGETPCLDRIRAGNYVGVVSNYLVLPLSARVNGPAGVRTNAPVAFGVSEGKARFLTGTKEKQTMSDQVRVRSDATGQATAWLLLPVDFQATNRLTISAGTGSNSVTAQLAAGLYDLSGTGQLQTNTNSLPMPLALDVFVRWLNRNQMPNCEPGFEMLTFTSSSGEVYLDTNLFLFPVGHTNDLTYLTLVNTTSNDTYQLLWKFDFLAETNWHAAEIITGNGSNVNFSPVAAYGHEKMFFAVVTNAAATVSIEIASGSPASAREPDAFAPDDGDSVRLRVTRTGPTNAALPVFFTLTGSARFTNDYALTNDSGSHLTNFVTISAGSTNVDFLVSPVDDQLAEFDESVVVLLLGQPFVTSNRYFVNTNLAMVQLFIENNPQTNFFQTVTDLPSPVGIDYDPVTNALIVSVNYNNGQPNNFVRVFTNNAGELVVSNWTAVSNLTEEIKLAVVKTTTNGFTAGEVFFGTGVNGRVGKLSADALTATSNWATLTPTNGTSTLLRGGLYVDQTGAFGNDLIVVTGGAANEGGEVWRIGSTTNGSVTNAVRLANLTDNANPHLEGVITLDKDALKYGPWAGKIITGAESAVDTNGAPQPRIYTISTTGVATTNFFGIASEDFDLIVPNQDLYTLTGGKLEMLPRTWLTNHWSDVLITEAGEFPSPSPKFLITHWDSTNCLFFTTRILSANFGVEHVSFAPINLPAIP